MELLFWSATALVFYAYLGYPVLLAAFAAIRKRNVVFAPNEPPITVVIAAFNEEKDIARKLELVLALDYPADRRQVIVSLTDAGRERVAERREAWTALWRDRLAGHGDDELDSAARVMRTVAKMLDGLGVR